MGEKQDSKMSKTFITGFGAYDTKTGTAENYREITFLDVVKMAETPSSKPKEKAQWAIFSTHNHPEARSHDQQRENGQFLTLAGDIDTGNPNKRQVIEAIETVCGQCSMIIYSTSGSSEENKKWRFLLPVNKPISGAQYANHQKALFDLLAEQGIECDRALTRPGQPIYLPNVPMDKRNAAEIPHFYEYEIIRRSVFKLEGSKISEREYQNQAADIEAQAMALKAAQRRTEARRERFGDNDEQSVVDAFNERHAIEDLLIKYGYDRLGATDSFRSKYQSSGSYATKSFGEYWVSLSASDAANGLGREKDGYCAGDAFDLFAHYEHTGDFTAAVRQYGAEINPTNPTAAQVLKPILGAWEGEPLNQPSPEEKVNKHTGEGSGPTVINGRTDQFRLHRVFTLADAEPVLKSNYLIKGWLGKSQMSVVYGPSNVGKSFFCLDMAFSIAANVEWNDCRVRGGPVLYLATEGGTAFRNRVYALRNDRGITDAPLIVRPSPIDLLRAEVDLPALSELIKEITEQYGEIEMICVDTLSRAMAGGNENGPEDMTRFIGNLDTLRDLTGAHIMVVHHSGKDTAAGARGHSSLRAATDTEIELEVTDTGLRLARTTKQRDMEPKPPVGFTLEVEELGKDEDGDPVTTAIIKIADDEDVKEASNKKPLGGNQKKIIECFNQLRSDKVGGGNPGGTGFPDSGTYWAIEYEKVLEMFSGKSTADRPKKSFDQAISSLEKGGEIVLNGGFLWIPKKEGKMG